jgi:nucleotide-binding universal stress UspA family protein
MTAAIIVFTIVLTAAVAGVAAHVLRSRRARSHATPPSGQRILFPFAGHALSLRALQAALRLAKAEQATLVPVFLARVPMQMPLDIPLPRQCGDGMPLLEIIEQRALAAGVPVDSRIERGRTSRHALREAIEHEHFDRVVVAAASARSEGFHGSDISWLLDNAPGEVVIIRPDGDEMGFEPGRPRGQGDGDRPAGEPSEVVAARGGPT